MKRSSKIVAFALLSLGLSACQKSEPLWVLPPPGNETISDFSMGENYEDMVYFKLGTNKKNFRDLSSWDLAFETGVADKLLVLNGGNEVQVYNTHDTSFQKNIHMPDPNDWQWDNPNGSRDSTAFGIWYKENGLTKNEVYLVDLGPKSLPKFVQMKILSVDSNCYTIALSIPGRPMIEKRTIQKDRTCNYSYFSLHSFKQEFLEPGSNNWDILFTKYRYVYYNMIPITPYAVCGVLLNTKTCKVYECKTIAYEDITRQQAAQFKLTKKADEIGYDWKYFDLTNLRYTITKNQCFIIEDGEGYLYKLKFIDFYDTKGEKGHPTFSFQRL